MRLYISKNIKEGIKKALIRIDPRLRKLTIFSRIILLAGIIVAAVYCGMCLVLPDIATITVNGVESKDIVHIIFRTMTIVIFGVLGSCAVKAVVFNLASKDIKERINEELIVEKQSMQYIFRVRNTMSKKKRIIIYVEFSCVDHLIYNPLLKKMVIVGGIQVGTINDYGNRPIMLASRYNMDEFVIYDYFEPNLLNIF